MAKRCLRNHLLNNQKNKSCTLRAKTIYGRITMNKIVVAENIMEFRQKNKLTQGEFGDLLGVSAQAISKWERELCYPDITILPDLAHVLGCTVNDFFEQCDT